MKADSSASARGVARLDRGVEPVRQFALARESAMPFTLVIGDAADLPERQLPLHQCAASAQASASIRRVTRAVGSICPSEGKCRHALSMISSINGCVITCALRKRLPSDG